MTSDLLLAMENKNCTALVDIDLSADFDMVNHSILTEVMDINFGVTGTALKWLELNLRPSWFKVNVGKEYSNSMNLELSVSQGSCGGPVLYLCYASTMLKELPPNTAVDIYG